MNSSIIPDPLPSDGAAEARWLLRLYVARSSARCATAQADLRRICDRNMHGRYDLEVVDIIDHPHLAAADNIVAIPTLIRRLPPLRRKLVGDLSNAAQVLIALDVRALETRTST